MSTKGIPLKIRLFDFFKGRSTYSFLKEFKETLQFSKTDLEKYRIHKLKKLLIHAEQNVPFYKKRFAEARFTASKFDAYSNMEDVPPLTRTDLQTRWESLISLKHDRKKLSKGSSSGSTGFPVVYYKDNLATSAGQAAHYLGWSFAGWNFKMKGLHIWGNPSTVNNEWQKFSSKIKARLFKHHKFPAYKLTEGQMFDQLYIILQNGSYD